MRYRAESSRITLNGLMQGKGKKFSAPCFCFLQLNNLLARQCSLKSGGQYLKPNPGRNPKSENCEVTS